MKLQRWLSRYEHSPCVHSAYCVYRALTVCAECLLCVQSARQVCRECLLCVQNAHHVCREPGYEPQLPPRRGGRRACACVSCVCLFVYSADTQIPDDWPAALSK